MKDEIFVALMMQSSERAQIALGRVLGNTMPHQLHKQLMGIDAPQRLAAMLHCPPDQVFTRLSQYICASFEQHKVVRLTRNHLNSLMSNAQIRAYVAYMLVTPEAQLLDMLFKAEALWNSLMKIDSQTVVAADVRSIFQALLTSRVSKQIELRITGGEDDWGTILQNEGWLRYEAIKALMESNFQQEFSFHTAPQVLAAMIDGKSQQQSTTAGQQLDSLALVYLRRRIMMTVEWLRDEALEQAQESISLYPAQRALRRLPIAIEAYERGAIRRALPYLVTPRTPLSEYLRPEDCTIPTQDSDIDLNKALLIKSAHQYKKNIVQRKPPYVAQKQLITFEIHYYIRGQNSTQLALRAHNVPFEYYPILHQEITRLKGADLATTSTSIGERILNTSIPTPDRLHSFLRYAFEKLEDLVTPVMILSGTPLHNMMEIPWKAEFGIRSPYAPIAQNTGVQFPQNIASIINNIRQQYADQGRFLEIIVK